MTFMNNLWIIGAGIGLLLFIGILVMIARFYRKVDQGHALIINKMKAEPEVTFTGGVVLPIIHRAEEMDISVKTIEIDRRGKEGLICMDNLRADIKVIFFVRVNKTKEDVLRVAQSIGCARASSKQTLDDLFNAKFSEALKTVGKKLEFEQLYTQRDNFKDRIIEVIGKDLNGYVLEDAAIDYLEQTPLESLDPSNILDARGIRKITEITSRASIDTNELVQKQRMEIGSQDLQADEAVYRFDQQRADAEAKRDKEIAISQARESNEATRIRLEEEKRTSIDQQKVEEEVRLAAEAKMRAIEVAEQARLREVGVETVRVAKAKDIEEVTRRREVDLGEIERMRQVEIEKKTIADVIRARVAVDKTVAVEEEGIKDLRAKAEAVRTKEVVVITAQAAAEESVISKTRDAEAEAEVAKSLARKQLTLAEAAMEVADRDARAKIRMAEGVQAEEAASGLAMVRVKEADAVAIEKVGLAEVKVRQEAVVVAEREGVVEALIVKEKALAEAAGLESKGLADVKIKEADAAATEKMGAAEASALELRMAAEASGIAQKLESMKKLEGESRVHEEFRLQLEKEKEVELAELKARVEMAEQQAHILSKAFANANFNIVGGDGAFFDRFVKAVAVGQSIDGAIDNSKTLQSVLGDRLNGEGDLLADIKEIVAGAAGNTEALKNLSITAVLAKLMTGADSQTQSKLKLLLEKAKALGLDENLPS